MHILNAINGNCYDAYILIISVQGLPGLVVLLGFKNLPVFPLRSGLKKKNQVKNDHFYYYYIFFLFNAYKNRPSSFGGLKLWHIIAKVNYLLGLLRLKPPPVDKNAEKPRAYSGRAKQGKRNFKKLIFNLLPYLRK